MSVSYNPVVSKSYAIQYVTALGIFAGRDSKDYDGLVAAVRAGLVAIATAPGTLAKKSQDTGVSGSKISRDIITGLWLAAHPDEDAIKVKVCANDLTKAQINKCATLKELQALMPKVEPKAPKGKGKGKPKGKPKVTVTTPDSRITAANAGNMGILKDMESGVAIDPELYKAYITTINAIALRHNAGKVQKVA
jgi:hypothetical protein